jgi:hypothetical protein
LTFKSIETILRECEDANFLRRFLPAFDGDECEKRRLYISADVFARLYEHPQAELDYWGQVRAALADYVKGEPIPDGETFFKKLKPWEDDVWEIRITFSPQSRLFGAFTHQDCFVAFTGRLRQNCRFEDGMRIVRDRWDDLFSPRRRFRCWPLNNCISNDGACYDP